MTVAPELVTGETFHCRRGEIDNRFRYRMDMVLVDPVFRANPRLFSRNRLNLWSLWDTDHGGTDKPGKAVDWAWCVLRARGFSYEQGDHLLLLTQPRVLSFEFNPVSFWLLLRGADLLAVIAEVNNTFGDRHCYVCHKPGFAPITGADTLEATKIMHVSPYQEIAGRYKFRFDIGQDDIAIRIFFENGQRGLVAGYHGRRGALTNRTILGSVLRRPFGSFGVYALIHWQALRLKLKGARYRSRPAPPTTEVT